MVASSRIGFLFTALAVALAALALPSLAWAGGWAVITLDSLPEGVAAGQPYPLGFTVRQHGYTAWEVEEISITARHVESGQTVSFIALPDEQPGHYQVELLLPQAGAWEWSIRSGLFPEMQTMPRLMVGADAAPAGAEAADAGAAGANTASPLGAVRQASAITQLLGLLAVVALAAGVLLITRSRAKQAYVRAGAGLLLLCGGLAFAFFSSANADSAARPNPADVALSEAERGQQLFLAKGCVVCHVNQRAVNNSEELSVSAGPNLSAYKNDAAYLSKFLADPGAVKPSTAMPNLHLAPEEIEALIAFINEGE